MGEEMAAQCKVVVDKVVAGEVVEVLGAYHVAGHNSDRLSHPDSPTEAGPIYPHGLFAGPQVLDPTTIVHLQS